MVTILPAVAVAVALAGCGGASGPAATNASTPTTAASTGYGPNQPPVTADTPTPAPTEQLQPEYLYIGSDGVQFLDFTDQLDAGAWLVWPNADRTGGAPCYQVWTGNGLTARVNDDGSYNIWDTGGSFPDATNLYHLHADGTLVVNDVIANGTIVTHQYAPADYSAYQSALASFKAHHAACP